MQIRGIVAGLFLALAAAMPASAAPMTFRPVDLGDCRKSCTRALVAEGEIIRDTDRAFLAALRRAGRGRTVLLNSPGGDLAGGILLGIAFREAGAKVGVVPGGGCYSACAYALLGGVSRSVPRGSEVGVHEFADPDWRPGYKPPPHVQRENDAINGFLRGYARAMGISPSIIGLAVRTRHDRIRVLSRSELRRMRVVNGS